jgi:hypothetical protein
VNPNANNRALPPAQWIRFLERAGTIIDTLGKATTPHAKAIAAGKYLAAKVGRTVPVCIGGRTGKATLRVVEGRAREKRYWFEVEWDPESPPETIQPAVAPASMPENTDNSGAAPVKPAAPSEIGAPANGGNGEAWE